MMADGLQTIRFTVGVPGQDLLSSLHIRGGIPQIPLSTDCEELPFPLRRQQVITERKYILMRSSGPYGGQFFTVSKSRKKSDCVRICNTGQAFYTVFCIYPLPLI